MNKPLILGHRGASAYAPENTLAAFQCAFELGADGIELDVTLTKDGKVIVLHDDKVDRTSDGKGLARDLTLAEIQKLDAGSWFDTKFHGEKIPTLDQVLAAVPANKLINIELKTLLLRPWPDNYALLSRLQLAKISAIMVPRLWESPQLELEVVRVIQQAKARTRVIVSSFNPIPLLRIKQFDPTIARGLLYYKELPFFLGRAWFRLLVQPHALHPRNTTITPELARWARAHSYQINAWTVDDADEARRLASLDVNAIITNKPDVLRAVIT